MFSLLNEFLGLGNNTPNQTTQDPTRLSTFLSPPTTSFILPAQEPLPYLLQPHDAPSEIVRRLMLSYAKAHQRVLGEECPPIWAKPERYRGFEKLYEMGQWLRDQKLSPYFWALGSFLRWQDAKRKMLEQKKDIGRPQLTWIFSLHTTQDPKRLDWALQCSKRYPGRMSLLSTTHKNLLLEYQALETQLLHMSLHEAETKIAQVFPNYDQRVNQARAHNEFIERCWEGLERQGSLELPKGW